MSKTSSIPVHPGVIVAVVATAVLGLWLVIDPLARARFFNDFLQNYGLILLTLVALITLVVAIIMRADADEVIWPFVLTAIGLAVFLLVYPAIRSWQQETAYAAMVTESDAPVPSFKERAPFSVAERQAASNLGSINGDLGSSDYLADSNRYTTLVNRRGLFNPGYIALVNQEIQLTGAASGKLCEFDPAASRRMDGMFGNSLPRAIAAKDSRLIAKGDDAWGYCDGDTPMVVVPVTKLQGFFAPIHVPAGVAIYNGKTGQVEIRSEVKSGDLPGPAIPLTLAKDINKSLETLGGDWWSTKVIKQTGITDEVKDSEDTNAKNASNFSLAYKDQPGSVYVSPFTSRAASLSIEHVSVLESGHVKAGEMPKFTLYKLDTPRQSNAATADRIKSDFADLNGWATGLKIQEIIPVADGKWAASIGLNQNVKYRVLVNADGSSCLQDAEGATIRCTNDPKTSQPVSGKPDGAVTSKVAGLSDDDLAQLQRQVTDEVLKRLAAKK